MKWHQELNVASFDALVKYTVFFLTFYLFINDLFNMMMNLYYLGTYDSAPRFVLINLLFTLLHIFILITVLNSEDEDIMSQSFWFDQPWVVTAIWCTMIFSYLPEISHFSWIVGLIVNSLVSIVVFIMIYIAGVTAFADSFNAIQ